MSKTEMKLFDKQFVYVIWDDVLNNRRCFYSDNISDLINYVNNDATNYKGILLKSSAADFPFYEPDCGLTFRLAYYDPNYELKCAFNNGKTIQYMDSDGYWHDCIPNWNTKEKYRVKPTKYYVGIDEQKRLTYNHDPATYKHVYVAFDTAAAASKWIDEHRKFVPVMRAFEKGLTIEYKRKGEDDYWCMILTPSWHLQCRYRVKPMQSVCYIGIKEVHNCNDCKYHNILPLCEPCKRCYSINSDGDYDGFIQRKRRRMTNRELAKWLADGNGQKIEGKNKFVYTTYAYKDGDNAPCRKDILIRGWNETEWHEPEVK